MPFDEDNMGEYRDHIDQLEFGTPAPDKWRWSRFWCDAWGSKEIGAFHESLRVADGGKVVGAGRRFSEAVLEF